MDKKKLILTLVWIPIVLLGILNLLTVFTPEIGFDALWYHLTLPKLWLLKKQWFFDGGLLYYSVMPRLAETIFIPLIKYTGYIGPKLVQYLSGAGVCLIIWKISTKLKFSTIIKSLAVSLFYCTWLVSWQSGSAYIDLFRTFLETTALYFFISGSWVRGGMILGLSVGTKWLSLGSVGIYGLVFGLPLVFPALITALPWFLISLKFTGNPVYPMFSSILQNSLASFPQILSRILMLPLTLAFPFDDFLSPMVIFIVVLSAFSLFNSDVRVRKISFVGLLGAIISVSLDPPSSRYFLPYFPAMIIASVSIIDKLKSKLQFVFNSLVIVSSIGILGLRLIADYKYFPYIFGQQTQNSFLENHSDRLPDTFIDSDYYVEKNIPKDSKIIIDKLHNLYYFPYNFDHTSWAKSEIGYEYLITKNTKPSEIEGELVHTNNVGIQIYKLKP